MLVFLFSLLTQTGVHPSDTAAFVRDSVVVRELGFSLAVPGEWLSDSTMVARRMCDGFNRAPIAERILINDAARSRAQGKNGTWSNAESVVDSLLPRQNMVAELRSTLHESCLGPQLRIYVQSDTSGITQDELRTSASLIENRRISPVEITSIESAGWRVSRLSWIANGGDFLPSKVVEVWQKGASERTVIVVFIFSPMAEQWTSISRRVMEGVRLEE